MSEIKKLEPTCIWNNFYAITQVPHPSGSLDKIQKFLLNWAEQAGVNTFQDNAGNIIMRKPATPGMEKCKTVTLQAHMDMVPQKLTESNHNFETDPIETYIDGEWVKAKGTTLGADDGMGVATIMAIMEDNTLKHGPLEGFITVDEESTMYGVNNLLPETLTGDILLNLDNETEGEILIGSAGGVNVTASMSYKEVETDPADVAVKITIKGLRGGHSGLEICKGRGNANKMMARFMREAVSSYEARLASWSGGNMRNAIPRECEVILTLPKENIDVLEEAISDWSETFKEEFAGFENSIEIKCEVTELPVMQVPVEIQDNLIDAIYACHDGIMRYIPAIPEIVETSSNLAIVTIQEGEVMVKILVRSSRDSMRTCNAETVSSAFEMAGMKIELDGDYPAWQPNPESEIVTLMEKVYQDLFESTTKVQVVHAGLECGVIGALYPRMDMVSLGPTIRSPHTPDERCHIPSVEKYYQFVKTTLEQIPEK